MPPDSTRTSTRRQPRKFTEEELKDIEFKRIKGMFFFFTSPLLTRSVQASFHVLNAGDSSFGVTRKFHVAHVQGEDAKVSVHVVITHAASSVITLSSLFCQVSSQRAKALGMLSTILNTRI